MPEDTSQPHVTHEKSSVEIPQDEYQDVTFNRTRRTIAEHMMRSLQTSAQLTSIVEADVTALMHARAARKEDFQRSRGFSLTPMPFVAIAAVETLRSFPEFNAHILEDSKTARIFREINLGIAVGRDEGLIVPVIHGAEKMELVQIAEAINDIGARARAKGGLTLDHVTGGTFTLTNYGSFGGLIDTPIIAQPQVAILGIGSIEKRPAIIEQGGTEIVAVRQLVYLSLTYDHRWIDGHRAARFNARLKRFLEGSAEEWSARIGLE